MEDRRKAYAQSGIAALCVLIALASLAAFTGKGPLGDNPYRSYTLQALAWLDGRLDLGMNYTWLELAIYEGRYYVSFPPFPSVVLLPFAAVFGENTPDHLISWGVTLLGVIYACRLTREVRGKSSLFSVLYLYLANGYLFIALQGWVWFLAQSMCFTLSLMALTHAKRGEGVRAMAFWACAVGCRPMVIVYLPLLMVLLVQANRRRDALAKPRAVWLLPAVCIGGGYMLLNALRFGNPLEFGHNYLPEFMNSEAGQFSLSYLPANLAECLRLPQTGGMGGALRFYTYGCMAFWLVSPLLLSFMLAWGGAFVRRMRGNWTVRGLLPLLALAHLLIVLCHRTMGGWQFGNRYLVDLMPWLFYGLLVLTPQEREEWHVPLFCLGLVMNLVGTVATYNSWIG